MSGGDPIGSLSVQVLAEMASTKRKPSEAQARANQKQRYAQFQRRVDAFVDTMRG